MIVVNWDNRVNKRILRNGTSWSEPESFIEDETRSGKKKRRLYKSLANRTFSVSMRFTLEEYEYFREWYEYVCKKGFYAFYFPKVDSDDKTVVSVYRFTSDGLPSYSNSSGKNIECSMKWEECE